MFAGDAGGHPAFRPTRRLTTLDVAEVLAAVEALVARRLRSMGLVAGDDVGGESLERVCRYVLRPPVAADRIEVTGDGQVRLSLREPWRDGTTGFVFDPVDFLGRLAVLVPRPRSGAPRLVARRKDPRASSAVGRDDTPDPRRRPRRRQPFASCPPPIAEPRGSVTTRRCGSPCSSGSPPPSTRFLRGSPLSSESSTVVTDLLSIVDPTSPASDKIALFRSLFRGRADVYPRRLETGKRASPGTRRRARMSGKPRGAPRLRGRVSVRLLPIVFERPAAI